MSLITEDMHVGRIVGLDDERNEPPWIDRVLYRNGRFSCLPVIQTERSISVSELIEIIKPMLKETICKFPSEERRGILDKIRNAKSFDDVYNALE
jgi:hypothetical protein